MTLQGRRETGGKRHHNPQMGGGQGAFTGWRKLPSRVGTATKREYCPRCGQKRRACRCP